MASNPVVRAGDVEAESFPWGGIKWLMGQNLDPDAQQTFGMVFIDAGQQNPPHYHPNCEEILLVLSGTCEHTFDDQRFQLEPGDVIRVPAGVKHHAINSGWEPLRAIISFSAGDRQTVFLDQE